MALALTRNLMMLRSAPALRASRHNARRALAVRAFKDEKRHQHKQSAAQQPQQEEQPAPAPTPTDTSVAPSPQVSAPLPLEAVPFRRMTDAMAQMQREMDSLMSQFGFNDPFFSASPFRSGARAGSALSPFALLDSVMAPPGLPSLVPPSPSGLARAMGPLSRMVPVEVAEDDTSVTITAEVPGFAKEDIKVTVDPTRNLLTISGERATGAGPKEAEGKEPAEGATSRSFMTFTRSFALPPDVDVDKDIKATAEHGVLKVVLPKAHQHEPASAERQIPVA